MNLEEKIKQYEDNIAKLKDSISQLQTRLAQLDEALKLNTGAVIALQGLKKEIDEEDKNEVKEDVPKEDK